MMKNTPSKPTMQMIANEAGVSLMTVSRALRNNPHVSPETREKIRAIAAQMKYRPNPLVSALMEQVRHSRKPKAWPVLAFLSAHPEELYHHKNTHNVEIYQGAIDRAEQLGYKVSRFSLAEPGMSTNRMCKLLQARGISGIILSPLPDPLPRLKFPWEQFSCVVIGYSYTDPILHRVSNDQFNTIATAVQHLISNGCRRIGLAIRHEDNSRVEGKWIGGFLSFHPYQPRQQRIPVFLWNYNDPDPKAATANSRWQQWEGNPKVPKGFAGWVQRYRPDAILCLQPHMIQAWLEEMDPPAAKDILLVNLNLEKSEHRYCGMNQNNAQIGAAAVELVVEQIHHNEYGIPEYPKTVMIKSRWLEGSKQPATRRQLSPPVQKN